MSSFAGEQARRHCAYTDASRFVHGLVLRLATPTKVESRRHELVGQSVGQHPLVAVVFVASWRVRRGPSARLTQNHGRSRQAACPAYGLTMRRVIRTRCAGPTALGFPDAPTLRVG